MIHLTNDQLAAITGAAEAAYPDECCGLLAGFAVDGGWRVSRVVESRNVTESDHRDSFEVDPQVRFDLMRALDDDAGERMIGHYHSHPDHPARPSERDRAMAYEPELVWIIVSVAEGRAQATGAFRLNAAGDAFDEIDITVTDRPEESAP